MITSITQVVVSAGHSPYGDPGAVVTLDNGAELKEADVVLPFRDALVNKLRRISLGNIRVVSINDSFTLRETVKCIIGMGVTASTLAVEIHMNAYTNKNARGVEVFVHDKAKDSLKLTMREFVRVYSTLVGTPNRGVKYVSQSARSRLAFIDDLKDSKGRGVGVIVELGFLTNPDDCLWALHPDAPSVFADSFVRAIFGESQV